MENMNDLMITIIEGTNELENGELEFSEAATKAIHEVAEYARNTGIYNMNKDQSDNFWNCNEKSVLKVYTHLLDRIVQAPTSIHREGAVLLIMPTLDDLLSKSEVPS